MKAFPGGSDVPLLPSGPRTHQVERREGWNSLSGTILFLRGNDGTSVIDKGTTD